MIYEIKIATAAEDIIFLEEFHHRFCWLEERGYELTINKSVDEVSGTMLLDVGLYGHIKSTLFKEKDIVYIFKHQMSEFLAEHVVRDWEVRLLRREICKRQRQIHIPDREIIYVKAADFLKRCNNNESLNLLMNYGRKNRISHRILDYLFSQDTLLIEGFINFCMQDYLTEIRFAVDLACEELKNEKEYNEFVKLLRYFVDTQTSRVQEVNVLMENNSFVLWDGKGIAIEEEFLDYYMDDLLYNDISLDDILISILITVVPRKIVLHNLQKTGENESVRMIRNVFGDRIVECRGCERCFSYQKTHEADPIQPNR